VERFYERFGEGDMTEAFAPFATDCISLTPSGALNNEKHEAVARNLNHAIPDGHMEILHALESRGQIFVTDGSREPTETISQHRLERSSPPTTRSTCSSPTTSEWRAEKSSSVRPYGTDSASFHSSEVPSGRMWVTSRHC
jgi:hypothetical protein